MITPLSNTTNVQKDDRPPLTNTTHRPKNKDGNRIPRFRPSVVSFGPVYDNMQQFDHFQREYHSMILRHLPPLVPIDAPIQQTIPSRVGSIPSSIKRSPIVPPIHDTTTLTRVLEPPTLTTKPKNSNISIFSGPHYLPEKYSVKSLKTFRQKYFVPSYNDDEQQTRYYVAPDVNHYFQAALQDGSYFDSYSEYNASDPINFRHAYSLDQSVNNLESQPKKVVILRKGQHSIPSSPSSSTIRHPIPQPPVIPTKATPRKWHKPVVLSEDEVDDDETETDDSDDSFIPTPERKDKGKGRAMEIDTPPSPHRPIAVRPTPHRKDFNEYVNNKFDRVSTASPTPPPTSSLTKRKRTVNSLIPTKREAIEEIRQLGKFIKPWKEKDAEVCCVCFEDVTTQHNPLYYCDNALCEVIVHKNCYKIQKYVGNEDTWYCDRCSPEHGGISVHKEVTCVACPSLTGAFCKLATPFNSIQWVHMICAKMLTGPGGFVYQNKTHDYRMLIRNHIPLQRFTSTCAYCSDPMFADYGAKLKCQYCPKSFHVTCAEKNGYWCFHKDAVLACSTHAIYTTTKSSPQRLAVAFERWISKRDTFYTESYDITPDMFKVEAWRKTIKHGVDVGDSLDQKYQAFFNRIAEIRQDKAKAEYMKYVKSLLNEFCRSYTATKLLTVERLFLKKNFYHNETYAYIPTSRYAFSMCDSDGEEEPRRKSNKLLHTRSTQSPDSFSPTPTPPPRRSETTIRLPVPKKSTTPARGTPEKSVEPVEKPKKKKDQNVVIYSKDLICSVCQQHEFPQEAWDRYNFADNYLQHLEDTKHLRKEGHTGAGNSWDPRVFIACSECNTKVHCGCPSRPIKKYPQKYQSFVCIQCDTKGEEIHPFHNDDIRRRGTTNINYKV